MTSQVDVWIGGASGNYETASNWYDETTQSVATSSPGSSDWVYFTSGDHSITGGGTAAGMLTLAGAHVTLGTSPSAIDTSAYSFGLAAEMYGSSLTVSGAAFSNQTNLLLDGATLDVRAAHGVTHANPTFAAARIGTLWNSDGAGNFLAADGNTQLGADVLGLHPGPEFIQTGGFDPHESFYGGSNNESLVLPDLRAGGAAPTIQLAMQNQSDGNTDIVGTYGSGAGYALDVQHQFSGPNWSYETTPIGTVTPITTRAGSFSAAVQANAPVGDLGGAAWDNTTLHIYDTVR